MIGGGLFGNNNIPLQATQRFWNLKQLGATPAGLPFLPLTCNTEDLYVAAVGEAGQKKLAIHMVNEGAATQVKLKGIPAEIKQLRLYITDQERGMQKGELLKVENGSLQFQADAASFISLMTE